MKQLRLKHMLGMTSALALCLSGPSLSAKVSPAADKSLSVSNPKNVLPTPAAKPSFGFKISVDGVAVAGDKDPSGQNINNVDVQISYDGLNVTKVANVSASLRSVVGVDAKGSNFQKPVIFHSYWNYGTWVKNAEILIFKADQSVQDKPIATIAVPEDRFAEWLPSKDMGEQVKYVLRLYDDQGNFDQTSVKSLSILDKATIIDEKSEGAVRESLVGYDKDRLEISNIDVAGGSVTVFGSHVPEGHKVYVMGRLVPVDSQGKFAIREIVSSGEHNVDIAVIDKVSKGLRFNRSLYVPQNDFFYMGLGDLTLSSTKGSGPVEALGDAGAFDGTSLMGRGAIFLKGKIRGDKLLTLMMDTGEGKLDDLFKNFDEKNTHAFLRRIDPNKFYPVYGDGSTKNQLAASNGKLFVKLEKGNSHVMWGNFQTDFVDTEFGKMDRSLYGAKAHYEGKGMTRFGEKNVKADVFAANPGTVQVKDSFRGTGGSAYFLKTQDLSQGTEQISIEVRDRTTGLVLHSRSLVYGQDYEIDYMQGRVLLTHPLPSTADDSFVVNSGTLSGNPVYLAVKYEYTPSAMDVKGMAMGGRASSWMGDHVKLGVTATKDSSAGDKQMLGADLTLRLKPGTYVKAEIAQTSGDQGVENLSSDGGYSFKNRTSSTEKKDASGYRLEAATDLKDLGLAKDGKASLYYQHKDAGFSAEGHTTDKAVDQLGASLDVNLTQATKVQAKFSQQKTEGADKTEANFDVRQKLSDKLTLGLGLGYGSDRLGSHTDLGTELRYKSGQNWEAYVFGQKSLTTSGQSKGNDRIGVGASINLSERLSLGGEISSGTGGMGARINTEYKHSDRTTLYTSYGLDTPNTSPAGQITDSRGKVTVGGKTRFTDAISVYAEEGLNMNTKGVAGLTHTYGLDLAPTDKLKVGFATEIGKINNEGGQGDISRKALSAKLAYQTSKLSFSNSLEYRKDQDSLGQGARTSLLARSNLSYKVNADLSLLAKFNGMTSSASGTFGDGKFAETSLALAYRPVANNRFNALVKYTNLFDLPSAGQTTTSGTGADYKQKSHILAADLTYKVSSFLTLGAKYAVKSGEMTTSRTSNDFNKSTVQLGILRADLTLSKNWDMLAEYRNMKLKEASANKSGLLLGLYRNLGNNFRLGAGYNFSNVSDDLSNVHAKSQGFFVNAVTKF